MLSSPLEVWYQKEQAGRGAGNQMRVEWESVTGREEEENEELSGIVEKLSAL